MEPLPTEVEARAKRPRLAALRQEAQAERDAAARAALVSTLPDRVDLSLYQGDDFFLDLLVDNAGVPADLTGYTAKAEIRPAAGATSLVASFDATISGTNTVSLHLPHDQSTLLTANAVWDVQITDPAGLVTTLANGNVTVTREVTQ